MQGNSQLSPTSRFLLLAAAFVVLVAGMKAAVSLLVPFLLALFISVIAAPPLFLLKQRGIPTALALLIVILGIVGTGLLLGWLVGGSLNDFINNLPKYQERLAAQSQSFLVWLGEQGVEVDERTLTTYFDTGKAMAMAGKVLSSLGNVLTEALFILITVIFILVEAAGFRRKLHLFIKNPEAALSHIEKITSDINRYMSIKTSTSLLTGVIIAVWLQVLGVDYPILWGTVAFLFNYIPNIGSIIAAIPVVLLALIQLGVGAALWTAVGYLVVNNLVGNVIEPRFMGRGLGLSPLIVFLSLVFWGWILGPVGMFLSVPLTMIVKIILDSSDETRVIADFLGPEPEK